MKSKKIQILTILLLVLLLLPIKTQAQVSGINITTGSSITAVGAASIYISDGSLVNNGTYTKGTETITFTGTAAKTISGSSNTDIYSVSVTNTGGITTQVGLLTLYNLAIASGSKFAIDPAKAVTVTGTLTNSAGNAGLVLQSSSAGTASLIQNTASVPATVNRYISGSAEAWHFLSSPVAAQSISGDWIPSGSYGNGTGYDLYVWDEATGCWIYKLNTSTTVNWNTVHPGSSFGVGRGYLYSVQAANPTMQFAGNLNDGSTTIALTSSAADGTLKGFSLVGNPFPSSADWQSASGWTRTGLVASGSGYDMWIWNPSASNYGVVNSATGSGTNGVTRYIAPMQGFFVRAASAGNLILTNSVRVHDGAGSWLKKGLDADNNMVSISINSETGNGSDEVRLMFDSKMNEPGAAKLFSPVLTAPSLYLNINGENLSVRYLTDTAENPLVPFKFKPGLNGDYLLQFRFDPYRFETVVLEDRQMRFFSDLKTDNSYKFKSSKTDNPSRFVLHFSPVEKPSKTELPASIYTSGNQLVIDLSLITGETEIMVCDVMGRQLLRKTLKGEALNNLSIISQPQLFIVRLQNRIGMVSRKIIWLSN
jgi:hypothetical protein